MLLDLNNNQTESNCTLQSNQFTIANSAIAFEILSSKLYSKPILAIVRELLTNAYDSQKAAGKEDTPIKVVFPDSLNGSNFVIRDYGLGLSKEDVLELYTTFFSSTKSNSNNFTGCFGLGSKTPFAYSPSFSVISYFNGIKYVYIATKKDGYPSITFVNEEATNEENGLQISIPIAEDDSQTFLNTTKHFLSLIPEIKIASNTYITNTLQRYFNYDNVSMYKGYTGRYGRGEFLFKQGQNTYKVSEALLDKYEFYGLLLEEKSYDYYCVVVEVPIGTLSIVPNREELSTDANTLLAIHKCLVQFDGFVKTRLVNEVSKEITATDIMDNIHLLQILQYTLLKCKYLKDHPFLNNPNTFSIVGLDDNKDNNAYLSLVYLLNSRIRELSKPTSSAAANIKQNCKTTIIVLPHLDSSNSSKVAKRLETTMDAYGIDSNNTFICGLYHEQKLGFMRLLRSFIWTLNSIEEYNFDVEYITVNDFYRKYPYKRSKSSTPVKEIAVERRVRYSFLKVVDHHQLGVRNHICSNRRARYIRDIKESFDKDKTLVMFNSNTENLFTIKPLLDHVRSIAGENVTANYLNSCLHGVTHILVTSKMHKAKFKGYKVLDFDDLKSNINTYSKLSIKIKNSTNSEVWFEDKEMYALKELSSVIKYNYNSKIKGILEKRLIVKQLNLAATGITLEHISFYDYQKLKNEGFSNLVNIAVSSYTNKLYNKLRELISKLPYSINKCNRRLSVKNTNTTYTKLTGKEKQALLNLLTQGKPNVLFQR